MLLLLQNTTFISSQVVEPNGIVISYTDYEAKRDNNENDDESTVRPEQMVSNGLPMVQGDLPVVQMVQDGLPKKIGSKGLIEHPPEIVKRNPFAILQHCLATLQRYS